METKIFTTEDGIDIYKGDRYYTMRVVEGIIPDYVLNCFKPKMRENILRKNPEKIAKAWGIVGPYINPKAHEQTGDIKYFSTKEAAQEYKDKHEKN